MWETLGGRVPGSRAAPAASFARVLRAAALAALLVVSGCGEERAWAPGDGPPARVVMIVADTLRPDRLPFYGGEASTAPFLAKLASRSIVYRDVRSVSSWTAAATASLFTSTHPDTHGVDTNLIAFLYQKRGAISSINRIPDDLESLPEFMASQGYATFGISANPNIGGLMDFDRGFDRFAHHVYDGERGNAAHLVDEAIRWQAAIEGAERAFLYIQFMDPHEPYFWHVEEGDRKPGTEAPMLSLEAYDGEIRYMDAQIERLFAALDLDRALVVFSSDHGQEFGEHGNVGHGDKLYAELIRIPLFIHLPGAVTGRVIEGRASILDVLPTLRELVGAPSSQQDAGIALLNDGEPVELPARDSFASRLSRVRGSESEKRSIVSGPIELIMSKRHRSFFELYDIEADPGQKNDLAPERPDVVKRMRASLHAHTRSVTRAAPRAVESYEATSAQVEALRKLGYVESPPDADP